MLRIVFAAVNPGNTINVKIANTPNPTKMGEAVFCEKTFLNNSFIVFLVSKFVKDGWVQSSDLINLKRSLKFNFLLLIS